MAYQGGQYYVLSKIITLKAVAVWKILMHILYSGKSKLYTCIYSIVKYVCKLHTLL